MNYNRRFLLWINTIDGLGYHRIQDLLKRFGSAEGVFHDATQSNLMQMQGFGEKLCRQIMQAKTMECVDAVWDKFVKSGIRATFYGDPDYPKRLLHIATPPGALFINGAIPNDDILAIGMVGTRRATRYGRETASALAKDLSEAGVCIVSGMARGIDTCAHKGALQGGAPTIAVLGCGLDIIYPPENRDLYEEICANGAVVSEHFLGMQPLAPNFPARNRIISGLSEGVVIVESRERGGSMITVDFATEQNRDIFAVPGNINMETSKGPNQLICDGAIPVLNAQSVLKEYPRFFEAQRMKGISGEHTQKSVPVMSAEEEIIYKALQEGELQYDALASQVQMPAGMLASYLTMMELKEIIEQLPGRIYRIRPW